MPPTTRKTPQDRKPKATDGFPFTHEGKTYLLPFATTARSVLPGKYVRDAAMDGEEGQLRLMFAALEVVTIDPEALDALYSKPTDQMLPIVQEWFQTADETGVSAPQS
jgi:hypothetical protein